MDVHSDQRPTKFSHFTFILRVDMSFLYVQENFMTDRGRPSTDTPKASKNHLAADRGRPSLACGIFYSRSFCPLHPQPTIGYQPEIQVSPTTHEDTNGEISRIGCDDPSTESSFCSLLDIHQGTQVLTPQRYVFFRPTPHRYDLFALEVICSSTECRYLLYTLCHCH